MKSIRKIVSFALIALMLMSFAGCSEDTAKTVIAKVNGQTYTKAEFDEYYDFYLFIQEAYGSPLEGTEDEMSQYKANMFMQYVFSYALKAECDAAEISDNTAVIEESAKTLIEEAKTNHPDGAYTELLEKYGYSEETIEETAVKMLTIFDYVNLFTESGLDNKFDERIAATVDGEEIPMSTFYYYALVNYLVNAINGSSADFYDTESFYPTVYSYMVTALKCQKYLEDNNIEISEDIIADKENTLLMLDYYGLTDYAKNVCYLTNEQINTGYEFVVDVLSAQDILLEEYGKTLEFTDDELQAYYNSSIDRYDTSTVKAYHILTEDRAFAEEMLNETGKTADGYMAVYNKYAEDERVVQAIDLGEFHKGDMVEEFEECAFGLEAGGVAMCETSYGYHIVYVYETNITETSYESAKDQVFEDYKADHIQYFGQSHLAELVGEYTDEAGEYAIIPMDLLTEYLYDKYDVEHNVILAVR